MKRLIALLFICILILTGCGDDSSSDTSLRRRNRQHDETTATTDSQNIVASENEITESDKYGMGLDYYPHIGMKGETLPKTIFSTTAEENGLAGTIYKIVGTVGEFDTIGSDDSAFDVFYINTVDGEIAVTDPVMLAREQFSAAGWDVNEEKLREYFPLPETGDHVVVFAEYRGMSYKLNCPSFMYGGTDYLTSAIIESTASDELDEIYSDIKPTAEQQKALDRAKEYLRAMPFSHEGLIDQLEYEGYATADATYAADNCGADWNEQALKKAKSYLDTMAFSYSGLVDQLEYEGFTSEQATYGADNCNADWNKQAALKAESYMEFMTFTRSELISQLKYEGFTQEQAVYGADSVGL